MPDFLYYIRLALRAIVSFLDGIIYSLDARLYNLMMEVARAQVFSEGAINEIASRVYQLLALFMMFRLIFVFITYVVNPDDMLDKTKGFSNIIQKMIITLGLIIITPWGFMQARNIQTVILDDGVIEYFIFGTNNSSSPGYELMQTVGAMFIVPYKCGTDNCNTQDNPTYDLCLEKGNWLKPKPENLYIKPQFGDSGELSNAGTGVCAYGAGSNKAYRAELKRAVVDSNAITHDLRALMGLARYGDNDKSQFYVEYRYPFIGSTLVGIAIGYMLLIMCIDVAVRSVKLAFYEIISPIPIISYIGPKNGKDSMLGKWFSQVTKTYADLFTRVLGLQLALFFLNTMMDNGFAENSIEVSLLLIIGVLTFAKKLPDLIKDLTGIDLNSGGFNLKKKITDDMIGGKRLVQATSAVAGLTGNTAMAAGRLAAGAALAGATGLKNFVRGKGFHSAGTFRRSAQAAGARMMAAGKATGGRLWKGALLGQDYKAKVGEDAGKYRENMRSSSGTADKIGEFLTAPEIIDDKKREKEQAKRFNATFGNAAGELNQERSAAKDKLKDAQEKLIQAETAYRQAADARKANPTDSRLIAAENAALNNFTAAQGNVKKHESQIAAIDARMKRAIEKGPYGKRRWQEYQAYKEYKDMHP